MASDGSHIVLDTRIDADDALNKDFVRDVQRDASRHLHQAGNYRAYCVMLHAEWHYVAFSTKHAMSDSTMQMGILKPRNTTYCVTSGLTSGYSPTIGREDTNFTGNHMKATVEGRPCSETRETFCYVNVLSKSDNIDPMALRTRTPTSAGMKEVGVYTEKSFDDATFRRGQVVCWNWVPPLFGLDIASLKSFRNFLRGTLQEVAHENAADCNMGKACQNAADLLKRGFIQA